jgi:glycosyltransferase involved in cell wall biosynthesis
MSASKGKTILLYYHPNFRSVAIETICAEMNKTGNRLIVLTQSAKGDFHSQLDIAGVENYSKVFAGRFVFWNYLRHFFYLLSFCRRHRVNVLWSHLNSCNLVAVFVQYFTRARVIIFRHHFHAGIKTEGYSSVNRNEKRIDRVINSLAREIVVPSNEVYNGMVHYEKADPKKISIIPYIYHFDQYAKPDPEQVKMIRTQYPARLLIVTASRMVKMKRHMLVLPVYKRLIELGLDIKVLLLDQGEERPNLEQYVKDQKLEDKIFFLGFRKNIIDYLAAADLLVHPSYTEASSSLVKEFGIMKKPVIVCSGVGDFDQYIDHMKNGLIVKPPDEKDEFEKYIQYIYDHPRAGEEMGKRLHDRVFEVFSPNAGTMALYLSKT